MTRARFDDLPAWLKAWVAERLGSPVVSATSQPGGYSPGTADRLVCADGTRGFLKAVHPSHNPESPDIHRAELANLRSMPDGIPVPRLIACLDEQDWVALLIEDVEGRQPTIPWRADELDAALVALRRLSSAMTPSHLDAPSAHDSLWRLFGIVRAWADGAEPIPDDLDPWFRDGLVAFAGWVDRSMAEVGGDTTVHGDLRADNVLVRPDGEVVVIDWPWAFRGAEWIDAALLLIEVATSHLQDSDSPDPTAVLERVMADFHVDRDTVLGLMLGALGFFSNVSRRPDPPGLPTLRAFQRLQADALLAWLKRELDHVG